jgi:aspartyl-tRNA(Asn)/glutamyl-tRNA(Gln) amidotransferase subunit C
MNIQDVENLAELARIERSEDEKVNILKEMDSILEYVKQVEAVEIGNVSLESNVKNVWREDHISAREFSKDFIIKQFPDSKDGFLKVKKIL